MASASNAPTLVWCTSLMDERVDSEGIEVMTDMAPCGQGRLPSCFAVDTKALT